MPNEPAPENHDEDEGWNLNALLRMQQQDCASQAARKQQAARPGIDRLVQAMDLPQRACDDCGKTYLICD